MHEKMRPSRPQKNDSTKPAIAMPEVRVTIGTSIIGGIIGMPPRCWAGMPPVRLLPHLAQNVAPWVNGVPQTEQNMASRMSDRAAPINRIGPTLDLGPARLRLGAMKQLAIVLAIAVGVLGCSKIFGAGKERKLCEHVDKLC